MIRFDYGSSPRNQTPLAPHDRSDCGSALRLLFPGPCIPRGSRNSCVDAPPKQVSSAEQTRAATRNVREGYERRISLLRSEHLDADMLDERARIMAGLVRPDEIIIVDAPAQAD